jgi:hypothetical protein
MTIDPNWPRGTDVTAAAEELVSFGFEVATIPMFQNDCRVNTFRKVIENLPSGPSNLAAKLPAKVFAVHISPGMFETLEEMPSFGLLKSFKTLAFEYGVGADFVFSHDPDFTADEGEVFQGPLKGGTYFRKAILAFGLVRHDGGLVMVKRSSDAVCKVNDNVELLSLLASTGRLCERYS